MAQQKDELGRYQIQFARHFQLSRKAPSLESKSAKSLRAVGSDSDAVQSHREGFRQLRLSPLPERGDFGIRPFRSAIFYLNRPFAKQLFIALSGLSDDDVEAGIEKVFKNLGGLRAT